MLQVVFARVREGKVDEFRGWMEELKRRKDEVLETFRKERGRSTRGTSCSRAGPVLACVMEVEDPERAGEACRGSALPIDLEHREVMEEVLAGAGFVEELLDLSVRGGLEGPDDQARFAATPTPAMRRGLRDKVC